MPGEPSLRRHLGSVAAIVSAAVQLGAETVSGWSDAETALAAAADRARLPINELRAAIIEGLDPLGEAFCQLRTQGERRALGQTYTPAAVITPMIEWAADQAAPAQVIDPGSGSGRFTLAAGRRFPMARLLAVDIDPVATLMTRAAVAAAGLAERTTVLLRDYRTLPSDAADGARLYLGNPPYVRHHQIDPAWKRWLVTTAAARGIKASGLSGLHAHFFLATAEQARPGDLGVFITSAEWLDVNYGELIRQLLLGSLGGQGIHVLDADSAPFADAATTGVLTTFLVGSTPASIRMGLVKSVGDLGQLDGGEPIPRQRLAAASRWTPLVRPIPPRPAGWVELGELCRVHRGSVTGANGVWVTRAEDTDLPAQVLFRAITRGQELFAAGPVLSMAKQLRCVIDLPADLDELDQLGPQARAAVTTFLRQARERGAADGFIARNRRAWWRVGLRAPAPILATYMARRPPAFVRNQAAVSHINIAHGLYPRQPLPEVVLDQLAAALRTSVVQAQGRTYAGGLTKFEPGEMERLPVPGLDLLGR